MRVFIANETNDGSGVYEDASRLFDQMRDCVRDWPTGSKVDAPVSKFMINPGELVPKVPSDIVIGRVVSR
jgi:hypothetical protein